MLAESRSKPLFIDIGANLTHESFRADLQPVLERAREAGVTQCIVTGCSVTESHEAAALCAAHPQQLFSTAGVHPHLAKTWQTDSADELRKLAANAAVVAIGEAGLDYNRNFSTPEQQRLAFAAQLELAAELGKPVFLHQRDAHDDFMDILSRYRQSLTKVVVHCFTGTGGELDDYLALDCYIGITGWICDERRGVALRNIVPRIPDNKLMIETDAPYLLPRDLRPKPKSRRNEPMWLPHIAEQVAQHRKQSLSELATQTLANSREFFGLEAIDN